jgi:hypothetical protein
MQRLKAVRHLFTDGTDTVIAVSDENADTVWKEWIDDDHDSMRDPWRMIPDDKKFSVCFEDEVEEDHLPEGAVIDRRDEDHPFCDSFTIKVTATAKAWADSKQNSFLCSTEY